MEGKIYEAISNVMADIGAVGKNNTNQFDKYKFRGIDDVMNALYPAMVKNHVFVTPEVLDSQREERASKDGKNMMYTILKIKYTFYTDDGSNVECVVIGEAMDRSDKSTNKAMSAGFKYACFQTFCIPTEELIDSEEESPEIGKKTEKPKKTQKVEETPIDIPTESSQEQFKPTNNKITDKEVKAIQAELERTGIIDKTILGMFKVNSFNDLTEIQFHTIMNKFSKTPDKKA